MNRIYNPALISRSVYGLLGLPIGIAWLVLFLTALSVSFGLLYVLVGFLFMSLTLRFAGIAADIERWTIRELLGAEIAPATRVPSGRGPMAAIIDPLRDRSRWRELLYLLLRFPSGIVGFSVTIAVWVFPIWAFSSLVWGWFVFGGWTLLLVVLGVASLVVGPVLLMVISEIHIVVAQLLLGPSQAQLAERAAWVEQSRDRSVEAAEAERRRIERNLHDGAQARLATVALDLGRAKRRLEHGGTTEELGRIIDTAHEEAKAAIVELRDLARGIHPAAVSYTHLRAHETF